MKITRTLVKTVEVQDEDLMAAPAGRLPRSWHVVTLRIQTDQGVEGIGICLGQRGLTRSLEAATEELARLLVDQDPTRIEQILAMLEVHGSTLAQSGLYLSALSAVDSALWDIKGKMAGLPLWRLLGGRSNRIATYASGPLHRSVKDDSVAEVAAHMVEKGFKTVKMHLALNGNPTPQQEFQRARRVREAIGPDVRLVCDINERWRTSQAIQIGSLLEELDFFWIEDPTRNDDYDGLARITAALNSPVMAGEAVWGISPFRQMLQKQSVDILMIDLMHVGGITQWLKVAGMAEAFNVPVVSHIMPEFQAQIVAAIPNGLVAEYKSWTWRLFDGVPEFENGELVLSERPGHGLTFSKEFDFLNR